MFPDKASVIRLVGSLLVEINDEMIASASVADVTAQPCELPCSQHPEPDQRLRGTHEPPHHAVGRKQCIALDEAFSRAFTIRGLIRDPVPRQRRRTRWARPPS